MYFEKNCRQVKIYGVAVDPAPTPWLAPFLRHQLTVIQSNCFIRQVALGLKSRRGFELAQPFQLFLSLCTQLPLY